MADFCRECTDKLFGKECKCNVAELCKKDEMTCILCEGCGEYIWVDCNGRKIE